MNEDFKFKSKIKIKRINLKILNVYFKNDRLKKYADIYG